MKSPENDKWLDETLSEVIGSKKPRTEFEDWKQKHPEAVEKLTSRAGRQAVSPGPLTTRRIIMTSTITKLAAAAAVVIAATMGIHQLTSSDTSDTNIGGATARLVDGPKTIKLIDGSEVKLAQGAQIQVNDAAGKRGFELIAGEIDVSVTKGQGEFIVTTPYGDVTALGTEFMIDLVDGVTSNTKEKVEMLAVKVREGSVQVSNAKGTKVLKELQELTVEKDQAPYDFTQDESLPARLKERIGAMVDAFAAGDAAAWSANFNMEYICKLAKGQAEYDPNLFGGSKADLERLQEAFGDVKDAQELSERMLAGVNIDKPLKVYLRSVELSADGNHANAHLIAFKSEHQIIGSSPKWHYFDNDWWQVDD
jgi:ferric-dicitrate binding protein FerR (iron transport regulator)